MSALQAALIIIGRTDADHVSIRTVGCLNGWMDAAIQVRAGAWSGTCRAEFEKEELSQFASEIENLYKELTGVALLCPMEPRHEHEEGTSYAARQKSD